MIAGQVAVTGQSLLILTLCAKPKRACSGIRHSYGFYARRGRGVVAGAG
jgi:hypothetical protein